MKNFGIAGRNNTRGDALCHVVRWRKLPNESKVCPRVFRRAAEIHRRGRRGDGSPKGRSAWERTSTISASHLV